MLSVIICDLCHACELFSTPARSATVTLSGRTVKSRWYKRKRSRLRWNGIYDTPYTLLGMRSVEQILSPKQNMPCGSYYTISFSSTVCWWWHSAIGVWQQDILQGSKAFVLGRVYLFAMFRGQGRTVKERSDHILADLQIQYATRTNKVPSVHPRSFCVHTLSQSRTNKSSVNWRWDFKMIYCYAYNVFDFFFQKSPRGGTPGKPSVFRQTTLHRW